METSFLKKVWLMAFERNEAAVLTLLDEHDFISFYANSVAHFKEYISHN